MEFQQYFNVFSLQGTQIMNNATYTRHIQEMILIGTTIYNAAAAMSSFLKEETGAVNAKGDRSLGMDIAIETAILGYVRENQLPVIVYSEEAGTVYTHDNPEGIFSMDPLDGSVNYKFGNGRLPCGTLFAFFRGLTPCLDDVAAAGVVDYTHQDQECFIFNGEHTINASGVEVTPLDWEVKKNTPVYLDLYYPEGMKAYLAFAANLSIRGEGSVVGNLMNLLNNACSVMGGISVRAEEIGAVCALVKGAGGVIVDHEGKPLAGKLFHADGKYPLLAGNRAVAEHMVEMMSSQ